jgi:plasmid stabilization system protein ParE
MAKVRWTQRATDWLEEIGEFIAQDDPEAALRTTRGIYDRIQGLAEFPNSGRVFRITNRGVIRVVLYEHYRIVYHARRDGIVMILGIYHGAIDINRHH